MVTSPPLLDATSFPQVWLRAPSRPLDAREAQDLLAGFRQLLDGGRRYVVISTGGPPDMPAAERREFALLFKHERARLAQLCAGMAVVMSQSAAPDAMRTRVDKAAAAEAYPYPVTIVASEAGAVTWAQAQLSSSAGR